MLKKLNLNQADVIRKSKLADHPLLLTCQKVFKHYMATMERFDFCSEDLFVAVAQVIDRIFENPKEAPAYITGLWDQLKIDMKVNAQTFPPQNDLDTVCTILFYIVAATLSLHWHSYYKQELVGQLRHIIDKEKIIIDEDEKSDVIENLCSHSEGLEDWINGYNESDCWLSDEIDEVLQEKIIILKTSRKKQSEKTKKKVAFKSTIDKPKTLKYFVHGNNGILKTQRRRVDLVFRKFNEWKWIDDQTGADDFNSLFEGDPRHCNITWTGNATILTVLLKELLDQPFIAKQTGQSATSMVQEQFDKTPNYDQNRLNQNDNEKIQLTLIILNTKNPLPEKEEVYNDNLFSDEKLKEIYVGLLRTTKGI